MSYLKPEQEVVQHFTHIHPLTKVDGYGEFTCDGCKTYGYGKTYRCACCDYNLHDHCTTCPPNLFSFMHPHHELQLVYRRLEQTHTNRRMCDICDESVEGLYYHCEPCSFDVHPLCMLLPQHVRHIPHSAHVLELSHRGASNTCLVCHSAIQSWRYKCSPCGLDIHMECVNSFASTTQQRDIGSQSHSHPFYQHHHAYQFNQHYQSYSFDQHYHNYGHGYNYGYVNQSQVQELSPSAGRRMFSILRALTIGIVCNILASPAAEALTGCF